MVVDDEQEMAQLLDTILKRHGADVSVACSASSALSNLEIKQPDVLISDISMPEHDGIWLMEQIRSNQSLQRLPAVALSAHLEESLQVRALASGFHRYLSKPISGNDLVRIVGELAGTA